jgi:Domain of unknown function (DUF4440)
MESANELLAIEQEFWDAAGDSQRYSAHLAGDAIHVFPGMGIAERDEVLAGVAGADPWKRFKIEDVRVVALGDEVAALIYTANAERAGQSPYEAAITSVYRRRDGWWELVLHQQTPLSSS